ncbi:MAG: hypothetical protein HC887_02330 [Desulfobacteraceae bacterium]|nr:hypothetical protein [Desulfobacteraceae bacterium]
MSDNIKKITDALNMMNVAMTQIRLYPPTSPMIVNSMNRAYQAIYICIDAGKNPW